MAPFHDFLVRQACLKAPVDCSDFMKGEMSHGLPVVAIMLWVVVYYRTKRQGNADMKTHPGRFKPGNKAAVGHGRPHTDPKIQELCRIHTPACVSRLAQIVKGDKERAANQIAAANALLGYAWGKPAQTLDVNANIDIAAQFLDALKFVNAQIADDEDGVPPLIDAVPLELPELELEPEPEAKSAAKRKSPKWHPETVDKAAKELEDAAP